jgi:hypothetical protein
LAKKGRIAKKYLNGESAKQMLIHYVDKNFGYNSSAYNSMVQSIRDEGFPQTTQNLAISNGGVTHIPANSPTYSMTGCIKFSSRLLFRLLISGDVQGELSATLKDLMGIKEANLSIQTYPFLSNYSKAYEAIISTVKHYGWSSTLTNQIVLNQITRYNPSNGFALDRANGSYFPIEFGGTSNGGHNNYLDTIGYNLTVIDSIFTLVPTVSSLCVGKGYWNLADSLYQSANFAIDNTPFERYRLSSGHYHTYANSTDYNWVYLNLRRIISGPVCPTLVNNTYNLTYWNYPVSWSTDKSSVATINSSGVLTKVSDGSVNVKAQIVVDTDTLSYQKRVLTGLPAYGLRSFRLMGTNDYTVKANAPASILPIPAGATPIGQWGYKNEGSSTIVWQEPSNSFNYSFSLVTLGRHVYFKALNDVFTSPVSSIYCRVYPVYHDPFLDPLYVGGDGNFYTGGEDPEQIETRSAQNNISVTYNLMEGVSVSYDHIPSVSELLTDLLEFESFTEELHKMKCWGDEPFAIFPVNIYFCNGENTVQDEALLKFIYNSELK